MRLVNPALVGIHFNLRGTGAALMTMNYVKPSTCPSGCIPN
jgi:hypothetical protein